MTLQPGIDQAGQVGTPAVPSGVDVCSPGQIVISSPKAGEQLQGKIILTGTVNVPNFGFYKYEYASRGSDTWATIAAGDKLKKEEDLGAWDTSQLVPGDYQIRLLVTDNLGKLMPACIISVQVIAP